jgi:signal-transduction protein with cAMP-binding, CBS, and nucleotidyltransferase domain
VHAAGRDIRSHRHHAADMARIGHTGARLSSDSRAPDLGRSVWLMATPEEVLAQVPLFSVLPKKEAARLAREAYDRTLPAGAVLTDEEETAVSFGVIAEGRAAVSVHGQPVHTLGPGDYFGEMALIDKSHRSAKITAETELRCLLFLA